MFGLFGKKKKPVFSAQEIGRSLTKSFIHPDRGWDDVCSLRSYDTSDSIAMFEMAFAKAAMLQVVFRRQRSQQVVAGLLQASNDYIFETFDTQRSAETEDAYGPSIGASAVDRTTHYVMMCIEYPVFEAGTLAAHMADRLGVPGPATVEIAPIFQDIEARAEVALAALQIVP